MKRMFFISTVCFVFCLLCSVGCSKTDENLKDPNTENDTGNYEDEDDNVDVPNGNKNILIAYFSRAGENWNVGFVEKGNTAIMGEYIQDFTGGDIFEIIPETPYPDDYATMLDMAQNEIDTDARPAIKDRLENLNDYSIVFIGSPVWHEVPPMIMRTFYETYPDLAQKTIVPFGTHGGSGINSCINLIREYFPEATLLDSYGVSGERVRDEESKHNVRSWLQQIGIIE